MKQYKNMVNTSTHYQNTHIIVKTPTRYKTHTYTPTHYKTHTYTHPHITKPTHYKTHTYTPTHYKTHTYTHPHITKPTHTHPHIHTHTLQNPHIHTPTHSEESSDEVDYAYVTNVLLSSIVTANRVSLQTCNLELRLYVSQTQRLAVVGKYC